MYIVSLSAQSKHFLSLQDSMTNVKLMEAELHKDSIDPNPYSKHNIWVYHYSLDTDPAQFLLTFNRAIKLDLAHECRDIVGYSWTFNPSFDSVIYAVAIPLCDSLYRTYDSTLIKILDTINQDDGRYRESAGNAPWKEGTDQIWVKQNQMDSVNQLKIAAIIKAKGYPGNSLVGLTYSSTAVKVMLHSTKVDYQDQYLALVTKAVQNKELKKTWLPYLIDRVKMNKGLPQIYGTQSVWNEQNKVLELYKMETYEGIDSIRAIVGLGSLEIYLNQNNIQLTKK